MDEIKKANKLRRQQEKFEAKLMKEKAKLDDKDKALVDIAIAKLKAEEKKANDEKQVADKEELKNLQEVKLFGHNRNTPAKSKGTAENQKAAPPVSVDSPADKNDELIDALNISGAAPKQH